MGGMAENDLRAEIIARLDSGKLASSVDIVRLLQANEDLEAENARLLDTVDAARSMICKQTTEIDTKDARIAELIGERDSLMDQCHGLQRLADERDGLRMRAATLEKALIEEMAARMWADEIFRYEGHLTWAEVHESEKEAGRQKARAVLEKKEVAP